jgi:hypothetical protein
MSIQKLSSPKEAPIFDARVFFRQQKRFERGGVNSSASLLAFNSKATTATSNNWKEVVSKRIEAKTLIKKVGSILIAKTF